MAFCEQLIRLLELFVSEVLRELPKLFVGAFVCNDDAVAHAEIVNQLLLDILI
jgi:hypothetical protein